MAGRRTVPLKTKRLRGVNWNRDSLKALLDVALTKRNVIRGACSTSEQKMQAWNEIAEAVSAVGVPRTPQECENKLRCYTSEVKNKFSELERASYQSGGGGGTPFKEQQPDEIEEMALAYLGIGFVGGRNTPLDAPAEYDYDAERRRELRRGQNLEARFDAVATQAKRKKTECSMGTTSEEEPPLQVETGRRARRPQFSVAMLQRILNNQAEMRTMLVQVEEKLATIEMCNNAQVETPGGEEAAPAAGAEGPVLVVDLEPEPPKKIVDLQALKNAYERYCATTSDPEWGRLLITALRKDDARKMRERIYIAMIDGLTENEVDDFQEYSQNQVPMYIRETMNNECQYRLQTMIATDLVAARSIDCEMPDDLYEAALVCSVRVLDNFDPNLPTIGESLREVYGPRPSSSVDNEEPQPSTSSASSASGPTPSTSAAAATAPASPRQSDTAATTSSPMQSDTAAATDSPRARSTTGDNQNPSTSKTGGNSQPSTPAGQTNETAGARIEEDVTTGTDGATAGTDKGKTKSGAAGKRKGFSRPRAAKK